MNTRQRENLQRAINTPSDLEGINAVRGIFIWGPIFSLAIVAALAGTVYGLMKLADLVGMIIAAVV